MTVEASTPACMATCSPSNRSAKHDDSTIEIGIRLKMCWSMPLDLSLLPTRLAQVKPELDSTCTIHTHSAQEHLTFVHARFVSSALLRAAAMLGALAKYFSSVSQTRKLLFALVYLPEDVPDHWEVALAFTTGTAKLVSAEQVRALCENLQDIDCEALATDHSDFRHPAISKE